MLEQKTAGTYPTSAQRTCRSASKLGVLSVPIPERLLYRRPHGIDRDSTRLLLCQGANGSLRRHFVNGRQNGGSEMDNSKTSVARRVGYLRYHCVARLYSFCPINCLGRTQGSCQSPALPVERLLNRLVRSVAGHNFLRNAAKCSLVRQGGSA